MLLKSKVFSFQSGDMSLTHCFWVISENITIRHILPKCRFFGLYLCRRQNVLHLSDCGIIAQSTEFGEISKIKATISFKVIRGQQFRYQSKSRFICDFLYVHKARSLGSPILHRFRDMTDYWSNFRCRQGGYLSLTQSFGGEPPNSGLLNLAWRS